MAVASALWLPDVFEDGMVLQTYEEGDYRSIVYGVAAPGVRVTVAMTSENASLPYFKEYHALAARDTGEFAVQLDGAYLSLIHI